MASERHLSLLPSCEAQARVAAHIKGMLADARQPSATELVAELDLAIGIVARWDLESALVSVMDDKRVTRAQQEYMRWLLEEGTLVAALRGENAPDQEAISTIDSLLQASALYRNSANFQEMVGFMGRFREYAPYNNMLVRVQNPSCSFYATGRDWYERFGRSLKDDARPMLILAPMHPVMLVYDLDQTAGPDLPAHLDSFAQFKGDWEPRWLERLTENAHRHRIRVDVKSLSSTHAGFATLGDSARGEKMRVAIHLGLSGPSQFGVLCHEMAHIMLGHLGNDEDHWLPSRSHLGRATVEVEAEATHTSSRVTSALKVRVRPMCRVTWIRMPMCRRAFPLT